MKLRFLYIAALAVPAALGVSAQAQEAQEQAQPEANAESAGYTALDPISIFATLTPIAAFDYPGQVSVIGREQIETLQPSSIGDVLREVPGVFVDGGARRTGQTPTIRGIREEDILVLLDGARQSFISGHDGRIFVEPDLLKSVEVVKGPISSLYGSGALGGVIALTTVDAADFLDEGETAGARVKAGYQSVNDEFAISTTGFSRSLDGRVDVVGSFTYRNAGDIELGNDVTLPSENDIKSSLVKGTAELAPGLTFKTSWVHYRDDAADTNNPQGNRIPGNVDSGIIIEEIARLVESDTVTGKFSYAPADNKLIDGNLLAYWSRNSVSEDHLDIDRFLQRQVETVGINIDNRSRFDLSNWAKLTLTYGAEYYQDEQTGRDNCPLGSLGCARDPSGAPIPSAPGEQVPNIPGATAEYAGAFTQAEFKFQQPLYLPGELTVLPAVRFDSFSSEAEGQDDFSDEAISKKLGIAYKPVNWLLLFGNYGEAFRAPSFNELYAFGNHFPLTFENRAGETVTVYNRFVPNPDLKPQDGETIEVGAGLDFDDVVLRGDKLTVKGSYYQSDVTNFIDLDVSGLFDGGCFGNPFGGPCISQNVNIANAELEGAEIELNYDSARFYGKASWATIDGRDKETGDYLGVLQPDKYRLDAGVKLPELWSRIGARFTYAEEFDKVNSEAEIRDEYALFDIYTVIEPFEGPLKNFRLDLAVENLTDEAYEVIAAQSFEEGRNYKAAITWTHKW